MTTTRATTQTAQTRQGGNAITAAGQPRRVPTPVRTPSAADRLLHLQRTAGNAVLAQLLGRHAAQRQEQARPAGGPPVPAEPSARPAARREPTTTATPIQRAPNRTGLPDGLKAGIEAISGLSMDGVRVHYNSSQPAQFNALAYTQGSDIYVAPGQERHLPHEAWHVVQQAQGRVNPTMQMKDGVPINDDSGLEHEAELMGQKALANDGQHIPIGPRISDLQRSPLSTAVQQEAMPGEEDLQARLTLQRPEAIVGEEVSTDLDSTTNSPRRGGQPLEAGLQRSMGHAMGVDFTGVKVHADAQADQLDQSIQAKAFKIGEEVFFQQEQDIQGGQGLIADELTHVVQQSGNRLSNHGISPETPVTPRQNAFVTLQTYRAEGAPALNEEERQSIEDAAHFMRNAHLARGQFFHVTNVANMIRPGGIFEDPRLDAARGGQGGAGAAFGGAAGAIFNVEAQNFSYATNSVDIAIEYFELHLSRAILENDPDLAPVVLKVVRNTRWDEQPDPAQQHAIMTPHGFRVLELIHGSDYFTRFRLHG
jgi:hypothetical protein